MDRVAAEGALGQAALIVPAEVHAPVFEPEDLFPGGLDDFADDVLVGRAIRALPGVEHVEDRPVHRVVGVHRRQPPLGGRGVGFLGVGHLGQRNDMVSRPLFQDVGGTTQPGPARADDQHIAVDGFMDLKRRVHAHAPLIRSEGSR